MIFGRLDERTELPSSRAAQTHAVNDLPRHVENGGRHSETLPGGERMPRPAVPDPTRDPE
jgi:hypothetical protein